MERASYWTQFGAMLIPIGVALLLGMPSLSVLAFLAMVTGFVCMIAGWSYTIRYENQAVKSLQEKATKDKADALSRKLEYRENILVLRAIAKSQGVKMWKIDMLMRRWMEKEGLLDEWGQLRDEEENDDK